MSLSSSTIYKNYIGMREGWDYWGQVLFTTTGKVGGNGKGQKKFVFCSGYITMHLLFFVICKWSLLHAESLTLSKHILHGKILCIVTGQTPLRGHPLSAFRAHAEQLYGWCSIKTPTQGMVFSPVSLLCLSGLYSLNNQVVTI